MPPPAGCPISWQPHALAPVFFGARSLTPDDGAPVPLRLFFPSLDGAVESAPLLQGCGRYPLVVLCHGHCIGDTDHYRRWFRLPAQLARSGCVVVVPHLAGVAGGSHPSAADHPDLATLAAVVSWARAEWEHADVLLPAPATAVVGHSFGALIGARFAALGGVSAFAGLSGVWQEWPTRPLPVEELTMPMLLFWGDSELFTQVPDSIWDGLSRPRHRVVYAGGEHWDYLPDGDLACRGLAGPCPHVAAATGDLVTMFLASTSRPSTPTTCSTRSRTRSRRRSSGSPPSRSSSPAPTSVATRHCSGTTTAAQRSTR